MYSGSLTIKHCFSWLIEERRLVISICQMGLYVVVTGVVFVISLKRVRHLRMLTLYFITVVTILILLFFLYNFK